MNLSNFVPPQEMVLYFKEKNDFVSKQTIIEELSRIKEIGSVNKATKCYYSLVKNEAFNILFEKVRINKSIRIKPKTDFYLTDPLDLIEILSYNKGTIKNKVPSKVEAKELPKLNANDQEEIFELDDVLKSIGVMIDFLKKRGVKVKVDIEI